MDQTTKKHNKLGKMEPYLKASGTERNAEPKLLFTMFATVPEKVPEGFG
jgi:hypothetical protein